MRRSLFLAIFASGLGLLGPQASAVKYETNALGVSNLEVEAVSSNAEVAAAASLSGPVLMQVDAHGQVRRVDAGSEEHMHAMQQVVKKHSDAVVAHTEANVQTKDDAGLSFAQLAMKNINGITVGACPAAANQPYALYSAQETGFIVSSSTVKNGKANPNFSVADVWLGLETKAATATQYVAFATPDGRQVDFQQVRVSGHRDNGFVSRYTVQVTNDWQVWMDVFSNIETSDNQNNFGSGTSLGTAYCTAFSKGITGRALRIVPRNWRGRPAAGNGGQLGMRVDVMYTERQEANAKQLWQSAVASGGEYSVSSFQTGQDISQTNPGNAAGGWCSGATSKFDDGNTFVQITLPRPVSWTAVSMAHHATHNNMWSRVRVAVLSQNGVTWTNVIDMDLRTEGYVVGDGDIGPVAFLNIPPTVGLAVRLIPLAIVNGDGGAALALNTAPCIRFDAFYTSVSPSSMYYLPYLSMTDGGATSQAIVNSDRLRNLGSATGLTFALAFRQLEAANCNSCSLLSIGNSASGTQLSLQLRVAGSDATKSLLGVYVKDVAPTGGSAYSAAGTVVETRTYQAQRWYSVVVRMAINEICIWIYDGNMVGTVTFKCINTPNLSPNTMRFNAGAFANIGRGALATDNTVRGEVAAVNLWSFPMDDAVCAKLAKDAFQQAGTANPDIPFEAFPAANGFTFEPAGVNPLSKPAGVSSNTPLVITAPANRNVLWTAVMVKGGGTANGWVTGFRLETLLNGATKADGTPDWKDVEGGRTFLGNSEASAAVARSFNPVAGNKLRITAVSTMGNANWRVNAFWLEPPTVQEGSALNIACSDGQQIIIDYAHWTNSVSCNGFADASTLTHLIQSQCAGSNTCTYVADKAIIGTPCPPSTNSYTLTVAYDCVGVPIGAALSKPVYQLQNKVLETTNSPVQLPAAAAGTVGASRTGMTWAFQVSLNAVSGRLFECSKQIAADNWNLFFFTPSGTDSKATLSFRLGMNPTNANQAPRGTYDVVLPTAWTIYNWYNIAVTLGGDDLSMCVWQDGKKIACRQSDSKFDLSAASLDASACWVGKTATSANAGEAKAIIKNLAVWDKVLSEDELNTAMAVAPKQEKSADCEENFSMPFC